MVIVDSGDLNQPIESNRHTINYYAGLIVNNTKYIFGKYIDYKSEHQLNSINDIVMFLMVDSIFRNQLSFFKKKKKTETPKN